MISHRPLLELANYHVLGRVLKYVPYLAPIPPRRVLTIFGAVMALVEALNALGVAMAANSTSTNQGLGNKLTLAALSLQLVVVVSFVFIAGTFHRRCVKAGIHNKTVTTTLHTLYVSMALILVRCIYRLVEHLGNTTVDVSDLDSMKNLGPIVRYEWFFYVFEATLMLVNSVLWNIWNPGRYLPRNSHNFLAEDGMTEIEGEYERDDRPLLMKAGSIATFGIFFHKKTPGPRQQQHQLHTTSR